MLEHIKAMIFGGAVLALIISVFSYFGGERSVEKPTFIEKFIKIYLIIIFLLLIGAVLDRAGCSDSDDDPDYPVKYDPN